MVEAPAGCCALPSSRRLLLTQELQLRSHVLGSFGLTNLEQSSDLFPNRDGLLVSNDDAGVGATCSEEFFVQEAEVGSIVAENDARFAGSPLQLFLV